MADRIKQAAAASRLAHEAAENAIARLMLFDGPVLNGFGVFADPSMRRIDLLAAKAAIDGALRVMLATQWPTTSDYDAAE